MKEDGGSAGEGGRRELTHSLLPDGEDHLVDGLEDVGLEHERLLDLVEHSLGLVERSAVEGDVWEGGRKKRQTGQRLLLNWGSSTQKSKLTKSIRVPLQDLLNDVLAPRSVDELDLIGSGLLNGEVESVLDEIDHDNLLGALEESPLSRALPDRSSSPDSDDVAGSDAGVDDGIVRSGEDVREVQGLLVGDGLGDLELWKGEGRRREEGGTVRNGGRRACSRMDKERERLTQLTSPKGTLTYSA
jgi:hypothetical protein